MPRPDSAYAPEYPTAEASDILFCNIMYRPAGPTQKISKRTHAEIREIHRTLPVMLRFLLDESGVDEPGQGHALLASRGQIGRAKNAVRATTRLQRRGMAAAARRRGLLVSVHADARCGTGERKHHLGMLFPTLAKESYSIGCGENSARPNALSRA
jgi:hypothetical protein